MLSILRRQSELLEKELLDLRRTHATTLQTLRQRDAELLELREALAAAGDDEAAEAEPQQPAEDPAAESKAMAELSRRLRDAEHKLTMTELQKHLSELKLMNLESADARQTRLKNALAIKNAAVGGGDAASQKALTSALAEVGELRAQIRRRDEQIEFLMQVHDASQSVTWVDEAAQQWTCAQCTLKNHASLTSCEACGAPR